LQELNRNCDARLMREAQGRRARFRGCDSLTAIAALAMSETTIVAKFERNLVSPPENREAPIA